jgi:biopolymer transport protein ExbD
VSAATVRNEINVTPLVDVVLVLLIIFMVVTPMLSRGAKVQLPETAHHDKRQDTGDQIVVSVTVDGRVFVDTDEVPGGSDGDALVKAVRRELGRKSTEGGAREVHVKADKGLHYGEVRKVLERVHEAGAPSVALGSDERKAEKSK